MFFYDGFGFYGLIESLFLLFFIGIFCLIIGTLIYNVVQYAQDKSKPIQTERATVVAKRTNVSHHHHHHEGHINHSSSTTYYVSFEFLTG